MRVGADATVPEHDFVQPIEGNAESTGRFDLTEAERFQVFLGQDFAGGIAGPNQSGSPVMVFDGDFVRMPVLPPKSDSVLRVHPNAMPIGLIPLQKLEPLSSGMPRSSSRHQPQPRGTVLPILPNGPPGQSPVRWRRERRRMAAGRPGSR